MFLQVSVLTKIVPSPDWFIGLSSVELCNNGAFVKSHTEEVMNHVPLFFLILLLYSYFCTVSNNVLSKASPLDAGTDNGFTFTSPNWETVPRAEVFQITNRLSSTLLFDKHVTWPFM